MSGEDVWFRNNRLGTVKWGEIINIALPITSCVPWQAIYCMPPQAQAVLGETLLV